MNNTAKGILYASVTALMWGIIAIVLKLLVRPPLLLLLASACLGFNFLVFIAGDGYTTPSIAQVFIQLSQVLFALCGFILMFIFGILEVTWIVHEKFTLISMIGAILVISGTILTILKKRKKYFSKDNK